MIKFKAGVVVHPDAIRCSEVMRILDIAVFEAPVGYDITVTSGCEGKHTPGSSHYRGKAWDLRTRDFPGDVNPWVDRIRRALGNRYFVLLESDHIHIQVNI
ncbi:MAG: hypothetical protein JRD68_15220 [Deltaproteobacteria bacterium]|nr:hypothetical protein [Deltaproteobacteria bacterium]